jgi:branched-chain amino acid transport system ATP-binding protein
MRQSLIARALMGRPTCLLLDEPSMGLAPLLVALSIADRSYVMEASQIVMSGAAQELINDPRIRETDLGI